MKLAATIQALLIERRWTLRKLAKESGVPLATLSGWTAGKSPNDLNQLKAVANAFRIGTHQLTYGESDPHEQQITSEHLSTLFSGDVRILVQKIERGKKE